MKSQTVSSIDELRTPSALHIDVLVIGKGTLKTRLERNLVSRGLSTTTCASQKDLDVSLAPDFIFWIPGLTDEKPRESLLNFAQSLQCRLTIVYGDNAPQNVLETCISHDVDARAVILHDLFGPHIDQSRLSPLWSKIAGGQVLLPENDTISVAPLWIDDAVDALSRTAFSSQTYNQTLHVVGPKSMTVLQFAYALRDAAMRASGKSPKIVEMKSTIGDGLSHHELSSTQQTTESLLSWKPSATVSDNIDSLVIGEFGSKKKRFIQPELHPISSAPSLVSPDPGPRTSKMKIVFGTVAVLAVTVLLFTAPLACEVWLKHTVEGLLTTLNTTSQTPDAKNVVTLSQKIRELSAFGSRLDSIVRPVWHVLGKQQREGEIALFFADAPFRSDTQVNIGALEQKAVLFAQAMTGASDGQPDAVLSHLYTLSTNLITTFALAENTPWGNDQTRSLRHTLSFGRDLLPVVRWGLGLDGKRTIALAIENSTELRPTGGFLSAVGFLTIEQGKIVDLSFVDSYQLDAQLVGREEPPAQIKKVLGESTWLIRDANWDADAPTSALTIERMINRATGRTVDAVVFIPTTTLQTILAATGPMALPGGEELTSGNILERAAYEGGATVDNGKQTDVGVSTVLGIRKMLDGTRAPQVIGGVLNALRSGDLVIASHDPAIAEQLRSLGVDGAIGQGVCPIQFQGGACTADSVYVVDANLGVNRADYFLRRSRTLDIAVSPADATTNVLTLQYQNTSKTSGRPGGNYRGYTRMYIPEGSTVSSVVEMKSGGTVELQADQAVESGRHVIGFSLDIPFNESKTIQVTYRSAQPLPVVGSLASYSLFVQKQPGLDVPTTVIIRYPNSFQPLAVSPDTSIAGHSFQFSLAGEKTEMIAAEFSAS